MDDAPVRELFVWIAHYEDGGETTMSGEIGGLVLSLSSVRRDLAEKMRPFAGALMSHTQHAPRKVVRIELRRYVAVTQ